ncbi:alpha/beta fold hydrolase [Falsiphaeobacter marinintestinus]|uniref:alpha/beta fold hydrolase n=1 Tax=Falsiphaeobacter marinintestinus TaxID=1492905 RepID=UPI0016475448|nr:alpha/beta hydrolase [Phaeobacter marinintestinus]
MQISANGINLEVETHGPEDGIPLILIRGLGTQLVHWPQEFIDGLANAGFRVVTFDNRDVGLSQRCPAPGVTGMAEDIIAQVQNEQTPKAAYALADMACDVTGLMDALNIPRAHVFGISMGGAITQVLTIDHADRLLSATIVMTAAALADPSILTRVLSYPMDKATYIEASLAGDADWGSPGYPASKAFLRDQAARAWDRGYDATGINRQLLATMTAPPRRDALTTVDLPCLVIHGIDDTLIPVAAGRDIAQQIPNCEMQLIEGMGHVITPALAPVIVDLVTDFTTRRGKA